MKRWLDERTLTASGTDRVRKRKELPAPALPVYRSTLEAHYARKLALDERAGVIRQWWYEPISLKLAAGKRYRPDFMVWTEVGIELVEVKGYHRNLRDSLTHLKWAAQRYPCVRFVRVWQEAGQWHAQEIAV